MTHGRLSLERVSKSFICKGVCTPVLRDISINFQAGASYAIMGVSGTGKSTLLHIASGVDVPTSGVVVLNGESLARHPVVARSGHIAKSIGVSFQNPYLIAELTVLENVALAGMALEESRDVACARAEHLLSLVHLSDKASADVLTLSGGQQQRVSLARALYHKPTFLIADEPTGNLDEQTASVMMKLIRSFCTEHGVGVIISTHDLQVAQTMDYQYTLHNGLLEPLI